MTGTQDRAGTVVIEFNSQAEKLEAPPKHGERRHYLPCAEDCGAVTPQPWNVVAGLCARCEALTCSECGLKHRNPTCASACCTMQGGECGCGEEDDLVCPVGDPDCTQRDGECHDGCEPPDGDA